MTVLYHYDIVMKRKKAPTREGMVITTVAMDRKLHRRLALAALEEDTARTEIMRQAITEWLDRYDKLRGRRRK